MIIDLGKVRNTGQGEEDLDNMLTLKISNNVFDNSTAGLAYVDVSVEFENLRTWIARNHYDVINDRPDETKVFQDKTQYIVFN